MISLYKCTNDEMVILNKLFSLRILMRINFLWHQNKNVYKYNKDH